MDELWYPGNAGVRTLPCAEQFRAMAFAQLTWRESLRDIEVSLSANGSKLSRSCCRTHRHSVCAVTSDFGGDRHNGHPFAIRVARGVRPPCPLRAQ